MSATVVWRQETPGEAEVVAKSFSQALIFEIGELEQRTEQKTGERDPMRIQLPWCETAGAANLAVASVPHLRLKYQPMRLTLGAVILRRLFVNN